MDGGTTVGPNPHRFTVAEYHRMAEAGILGKDSRCELIRGQIIDMALVGAPHAGMVIRCSPQDRIGLSSGRYLGRMATQTRHCQRASRAIRSAARSP